MKHDGRIDIAEWRRMVGVLADRFEGEVYRLVGSVVVAAAEVEATAARLSDGAAAIHESHVSAPAAAAGQVAAGVHSIAAAAEDLSRSVDAVVRQMIAAFRLSRSSGADEALTGRGDVDRLVQAVQLSREIEALVTEIAGLTNLLAMTLTMESTHPDTSHDDLAAAARKVEALADRAVHATEEIAWQIAEIQQRVAQATAAVADASPADASCRHNRVRAA